MDKDLGEVPAVAEDSSQAAAIDASGYSLDAVRALVRRARMPGSSWPTELRHPKRALMGGR